jgi:hypothetical protein
MNTFKLSSALQAGLKAIGIDLAVLLRKSGLPLTLWTTGQGMSQRKSTFTNISRQRCEGLPA